MMKHFLNLNHNRFICRFDWLFMDVRLTVGLVDNTVSNEASHRRVFSDVSNHLNLFSLRVATPVQKVLGHH